MERHYKNIKFQYYDGNIRRAKPLGFLSLADFVDKHMNPSIKMLDVFDEIEQASLANDIALKREIKTKKLFYFTPGAIFNGRRKYENIVEFTGLAQLDFDNIDPNQVEDLKEYLFEKYEQFYCVYASPSRKGVKGLIRIPICQSIEEFKRYYKGIENEFSVIDGFDPAPKNLALPLFLSYDFDILYRHYATEWTVQGELLQDQEMQSLVERVDMHDFAQGGEDVYKSKEYYRKITLQIYKKKIDAIVDNGHPQARNAALVLGSRVGAGYVDELEARQFAEQVIRSNQYLSKEPDNYVQTMNWAINQSIFRPKYYE